MSIQDFLLQHKAMVDTMFPKGALQEYLRMTKAQSAVQDVLKYSSIQATGELLQVQSAVAKIANPSVMAAYDIIYSHHSTWLKFQDIPEEEFEEEIKVKHNQVKRIITDIYKDNSLFLRIDPREFEEVINELLRHQGYETQLTKQTRDDGYDILALKTLAGNIPIKMLVECKRYKHKVGVDVIRSFKDVIATENANLGMLVTTGYFTRDAKAKQQKSKYILSLKDKEDIVEWTNDYIINPFGKSSLE